MFTKLIGVGAVAAVLLDATVVRALLVPSLMKLLGEWNWGRPNPFVASTSGSPFEKG